jgi:transglutaminase-like putative cysteine protease
MGQLKHRFLILGLTLLVLIIALAGLLGVLDTLPKADSTGVPSTANLPSDNSSAGNTSSGNTSNENSDGGLPQFPNVELPEFSLPDINLPVSLPDSFKLDVSKAAGAALSLDGEALPHYPLFNVTGAQDTQFLKSMTSSYFDGTAWADSDLSDFISYNGTLSIPSVIEPDQILTDEISIGRLADIIDGKTAIPTSLYPTSINATGPLLYNPDDMTFMAEAGFPEEYSFDTVHYNFDQQSLADAHLDPEPEYLQLPDNITPRTFELAENITSGIESPFFKAKAIEDYLKTNYAYDFNADPAPEGWEPNDYFLFESKAGMCTNFNSAFVILARAADIPARLAGGYAVTPQEDSQTVYSDQAHAWSEVKFKELGWYNFDATGSPSPPVNTVTEVTEVNPVAEKGEQFIVVGTVWTESAQPADGTLVEILVNTTKKADGAVTVGKGIVSEGHFNITAIIPGDAVVGNYHVLAHSLASDRYQESWSDPVIKVVSATEITLGIPPRIKAGQTLMVAGYLTGKYGEPLSGQALDIYVNGEKAAGTITDSKGYFTWEKSFNEPGNYVLQITFLGTEFFLASTEETEFRVLYPAAITLKSGSAAINKPFKISGRLAEATTDIPLPDRIISVAVDGDVQENQLVTDKSGKFTGSYACDTAGMHRVEVKFAGDEDYFAVSAAVDIDVSATGGSSAWIIVFIVIGLAAAGVGGWLLYRWQKNRPLRQVGADAADDTAPAVTEAPVPWQQSAAGLSLEIGLPQITPPLPDVWGQGEALIITFRLAENSGLGIAAPLEITINGEVLARPQTSADGVVGLRHTFPSKGRYELAAKYQENPGARQASAGRTVRIVDYREEIVALFNEMLGQFRAAGIPIKDEYTPRKIQYLVVAANSGGANIGVPEKALEDAIYCFEETDYSLHAITRRHYEMMYLAWKEIREHGIEPARS